MALSLTLMPLQTPVATILARHTPSRSRGRECQSRGVSSTRRSASLFGRRTVNSGGATARAEVDVPECDWVTRTSRNYTEAEIRDAESWQRLTKANAQRAPPVHVDPSKLNEAQAFIYCVVEQHHQSPSPDPLQMMVCGTAGSGKTFLIRALKQLLGDECAVCAPTGVAADNIGGRTYHSLLPMPRVDIDREDIKLADGPRKDQRIADPSGTSSSTKCRWSGGAPSRPDRRAPARGEGQTEIAVWRHERHTGWRPWAAPACQGRTRVLVVRCPVHRPAPNDIWHKEA